MAHCLWTSTIRPRPRPEHKRVWASLAQAPEEVITAMFDEAAQRDLTGQKRWIALVDGNETQIEHLHRHAEERKIPLLLVLSESHRKHGGGFGAIVPTSPVF